MATQLLAVGSTAASSADLVVAPGSPVTVCLNSASGPLTLGDARMEIQFKDFAGQSFTVEALTCRSPAMTIIGAGTYRFTRPAGPACGVFSG